MKSYDVHVVFNRDGSAMASCTLEGRRREAAVPLSDAELDVLARIATRAACKDAVDKLPTEDGA